MKCVFLLVTDYMVVGKVNFCIEEAGKREIDYMRLWEIVIVIVKIGNR